MRLRNYSHKTIKAYVSNLRTFAGFLSPLHPRDAVERDIRRFLLHLIDHENRATGTVNQAFNALRFLYAELYKRPFVISGLPRPRKERTLPDILSQSEVSRIFQMVGNIKHRTMLMLAYASGLRVSELVKLRIEDIDGDRCLIHIRAAKGKKDRYTLLPESLRMELARYWRSYRLGSHGWLFPGHSSEHHLSIRSIQAVFERAVHAAGITKQVSMHSLRHAFATHLLDRGTDLRHIQTLLGYQSVKTTEVYTHVTTRSIGKIRSPLDFLSDNDEYPAGQKTHELVTFLPTQK